MKFLSVEARVYPSLGLELQAGDVVDLPDGTEVAGLVPVVEPSKPVKDVEKPADVKESP